MSSATGARLPSKFRFDVDALRPVAATRPGSSPDTWSIRHCAIGPRGLGTPCPDPPPALAVGPFTDPGTTSMVTVSATPRVRAGSLRQRADPRYGRWCSFRGTLCPQRCLFQRRPRFETHAKPKPSARRPARWDRRSPPAQGTDALRGRPWTGVGPPGDERAQRGRVDRDLFVENWHRGPWSGVRQSTALSNPRAPARDREGIRTWSRPARSSRRALRPRDMLQIVIRCSMDSPAIAGPRYSRTYPWPPPVPISAMIARIKSWPSRRRATPLDVDRHGLERLQRQGLGREHMLDLAGADPEGEGSRRPHGSMCGCRRRPQIIRAGWRPSCGPTMDDALVGVPERTDGHAELGAVGTQRVDLSP